MMVDAELVRSADSLQRAIAGIAALSDNIELRDATVAVAEVHNLAGSAHALLSSAIAREESRGTHYLSDYPDSSAAWRVRLVHAGQFTHPGPASDGPVDLQRGTWRSR